MSRPVGTRDGSIPAPGRSRWTRQMRRCRVPVPVTLLLVAVVLALPGVATRAAGGDVQQVTVVCAAWIGMAFGCRAAVRHGRRTALVAHLRRSRHDEQVLRELASALGEDRDPAAVAGRLARFAHSELPARRVAVAVFANPGLSGQPRPTGIAAVVGVDGTQQVMRLPDTVDAPAPAPDDVLLRHRPDPDTEQWLPAVLPYARNIVVVPFVVPRATGALVVEQPRRWLDHWSRQVDRHMIVIADRAAAHGAVAIDRVVAAAKPSAAPPSPRTRSG